MKKIRKLLLSLSRQHSPKKKSAHQEYVAAQLDIDWSLLSRGGVGTSRNKAAGQEYAPAQNRLRDVIETCENVVNLCRTGEHANSNTYSDTADATKFEYQGNT